MIVGYSTSTSVFALAAPTLLLSSILTTLVQYNMKISFTLSKPLSHHFTCPFHNIYKSTRKVEKYQK